MPFPFPRLIPALLALSLFPAQAAPRRDREVIAPPPPQAVPVRMKATRGQEIEIPLRTYSRRSETLTFLVRQPPRSGRLSEPRNVDPNVGSVRYRPPDDRRIVRDVFQYAVKSSDGVSARVPVEIEIVDVPAMLVTPVELTFPARLTGTSEVQTLEIENQGGTAAEGECFAEEPWQIEGSNRYRVEPGARAIVRIRFAPTKSGSFTAEVRLSSQIDRVTTLRGSAHDPIEIVPTRIVFQPEMTTLVRSGACEITNRTSEPQNIRVALPERLRSEAEFTLAPGQSRALVVQTRPGDAAAVDAQFSVEAGPYKASASVTADPLPAVIRATPAEIVFRRDNPPSILMENDGGLPAEIKIEAGPNLRAEPAALALAPGTKAHVVLASDSHLDGWESHVDIRSPAGSQRIAVRARASIASRPISVPGSAWSQNPSPLVRATRSEPIAEPPNKPALAQNADRLPFLMVRPTARTSTSCILDWPASISDAKSFAAQIRELALDKASGTLIVTWRDHLAVRFESNSTTTRATIEGLKPGRPYSVRIVPAGAAAAQANAIVQCNFDTVPVKPPGIWQWLGKAAVLGALGAAGFFVWKRRIRNRPAA